MLALRTGWTDRTLADGITDDFRRACHHALYAEALAGDLAEARAMSERAEAIEITAIPTSERAALRTIRASSAGRLASLRGLLGLDDDG